LWAEPSLYNATPISLNPFMYLPHGRSAKQALPNCTECHGCNTELAPIGSLPGSFLGVKVAGWRCHTRRCQGLPPCALPPLASLPAAGQALQQSCPRPTQPTHPQVTQQEDTGGGMYRSFWAKTKRTASGMAMVRVYCLPPAGGQDSSSQVRWAAR
jgi:hypothetical protein